MIETNFVYMLEPLEAIKAVVIGTDVVIFDVHGNEFTRNEVGTKINNIALEGDMEVVAIATDEGIYIWYYACDSYLFCPSSKLITNEPSNP